MAMIVFSEGDNWPIDAFLGPGIRRYMVLYFHFAVMKVDVVCLQTLMQTTAMHWVMVLELSFILERPG